MNEKPIFSSSYFPQLHGLRTVAIAWVIICDYIWSFSPNNIFLDLVSPLGVTLLFVLGGFLMTRVLLVARFRKQMSGYEKRRVLLRFYLRRVLRFAPLYFVLCIAAMVVDLPGSPPMRGIIGWLVTFTANILACLQGIGALGAFTNFWSISVGLQFFLVWPWLVLFAPRKALIPIAIGVVATAPLYRWYGFNSGFGPDERFYFTVSCFDSLGLGALLAILPFSDAGMASSRKSPGWLALSAIVATPILLKLYSSAGFPGAIAWALPATTLALAAAWLVNAASIGFNGRLGALLESRPVTYVATISYGIYLLYPLIASLSASPLLAVPLTVLAASISWFLLERPINGFKGKFQENVPELVALLKGIEVGFAEMRRISGVSDIQHPAEIGADSLNPFPQGDADSPTDRRY